MDGFLREDYAMGDVRNQVFGWASGIEADETRPVVVTAHSRWVEPLLAGGLINEDSDVYVPEDETFVPVTRTTVGYRGDFADPRGVLSFSDGLIINQSPYGLASLIWLEEPTILRIVDDNDFSAFLRDADVAHKTGQFALHAVHPGTAIADLAALGGPFGMSGPDRRAFVSADGSVSTSPAGRILGDASESRMTLQARWSAINTGSDRPCAVCLASISDRDRTEALAERPWMDSYIAAMTTLRATARTRQWTLEQMVEARIPEFGLPPLR